MIEELYVIECEKNPVVEYLELTKTEEETENSFAKLTLQKLSKQIFFPPTIYEVDLKSYVAHFLNTTIKPDIDLIVDLQNPNTNVPFERRVSMLVIKASMQIAVEGRHKPGNVVLCNSKVSKLLTSTVTPDIKLVINEFVDDNTLYVINKHEPYVADNKDRVYAPGYYIFKNSEQSVISSIGLFPERQIKRIFIK